MKEKLNKKFKPLRILSGKVFLLGMGCEITFMKLQLK